MPVVAMSADKGLLARWRIAVDEDFIITGKLAEIPGGAVVLLDAGLFRGMTDADKRLAALCKERRVILADPAPAQSRGLAALQAGCAGYCHAYTEPSLLRQVIAVVHSGEVWVGKELLGRLLGALNDRLPATTETWREALTERERDVAQLAASGLANKEIADQLDITVRTVKAHLTNAFAKLGVRDRVQLTLRLRR